MLQNNSCQSFPTSHAILAKEFNKKVCSVCWANRLVDRRDSMTYFSTITINSAQESVHAFTFAPLEKSIVFIFMGEIFHP